MHRIAIPISLLILTLHPHRAPAGDKPGCADPSWAPRRLPGFEISDCETKPWAPISVELASGSRTLEGEVSTVTYSLTDPAKDPSAATARAYYAAVAGAANAKVVSPADDGWNLVLEHKAGADDVYYLYSHGSGNEDSTGSYTLTTIRVGAMKQAVVAKVAKVEGGAGKCQDPPWLVTGMPGFKLAACTPRDLDQVTIETASGDKVLVGTVLEHVYELQPGAADPSPALVQRNFIAALEKIGAKLVSRRDDAFTAVLTQKLATGEVWYVYKHGAGNEESTRSYSLLTVGAGAPPKACKLEIYGVHFDTDKATLRPDADPVLQRLLGMFKADAALAGELSGHTDDVGDNSHNEKLSLQRADAVKAWLVGHGVEAARLTTRGYGDTRPLAPNTGSDNRARNRRVELARKDCKPEHAP